MADDETVVFVVDDEQEMRDSLSDLFAAVGRRTVTFPSSESFLESFDSTVPSCLVLDVRMPGMDGIELLRELRKKFERSDRRDHRLRRRSDGRRRAKARRQRFHPKALPRAAAS